jgi:hypothetical protein
VLLLKVALSRQRRCVAAATPTNTTAATVAAAAAATAAAAAFFAAPASGATIPASRTTTTSRTTTHRTTTRVPRKHPHKLPQLNADTSVAFSQKELGSLDARDPDSHVPGKSDEAVRLQERRPQRGVRSEKETQFPPDMPGLI